MYYLKRIYLLFSLCQTLIFAQVTANSLSLTDFTGHFPLVNLSVSDGLYENNIKDVLQDSYGFLWLAGMAGLQKYDGYTFEYYKPDSINTAWQDVERLFEDSKRQLWVQLKEGLVKYQREADSFVKYYLVNEKWDTISYVITAMTEDMEGAPWFWIYGKGLFTVDHSKNHFTAHKKLNKMYAFDLNDPVHCLVFDTQNNLWIGTNSYGLIKINPQKDIIKKYQSNPAVKNSLSNNSIRSSLRDQNGDMWFATNRGLNRYNHDKNSFEKFYIDSANPQKAVNMIQRIADDGLGNIWTITNTSATKGIGRFNKKSKQFKYDSGVGGWPTSVTVDRSGIIWFGNSYQGVYKLDFNAHKFSTLSIKKNGTDLLKGKTIQAICKDQNGNIWFGGNPDGLYCFNTQTGKYTFYGLNKSQTDIETSNYILDIFKDSRGLLWIGTKSGLIQFNTQTGRFKHIHPSPNIWEGFGRTGTILETSRNLLWILTLNGNLAQLDPKTEETEFFSFPDKKMSFRNCVLDSNGFLWIGTFQNGLIKFNTTKKTFSAVKELPNSYISSLSLEGDSILWCSTNGDGLIRFNIKTKSKSTINETNGLLSNGILGMEQDLKGNLWLSSSRGLTCYNPNTKRFKNYFKEDGFLTNEFHYRGHFKDKNGQMMFGTNHGLVTFHPDNIKENDYKPPLELTNIEIDNKEIKPGKTSPLKKHISVSKEIILNHDQNDLSISFASLDFNHPQRNEYAFYLQNLEDSWRPSGKERTAYYTNLSPGEYVFKVKGTNSDGLWNEEGTSLKIVILPPWWKTWQAYILYLCLLIGFLYALRNYELNRQNLKHNLKLEHMQAEKYQEIDHLKSQFFTNISHEFRTPLTLIEGPIKQILRGDFKGNIKDQYQMMLRNTRRLKQLINQLLDLSQLDSGKMKLKARPQNIIPILKGLIHSFESLARQKNIDLDVQFNIKGIEVYIDRDKFEKIIVNLLSNAFKFTPAGGKIGVDVTIVSSPLPLQKRDAIIPSPEIEKGLGALISVINTGSVIPSRQLDKIFDRFYQIDDSLQHGQEGSGIGLALAKELTELHHGTITVTSNPDQGTTFKVQLALGNKHMHPKDIISETSEASNDHDIGILPEQLKITKNLPDKIIPKVGDFPKLLIVEDNPDMRSFIHSCLESQYKIIQAENGEKGLQEAIKQTPDIIVSDVMMPGMDGLQFCSKIKTDQRTSHIPVILLTAKASVDNRIEGLETGADDYVTKPFDKNELSVRLNNLIVQRKKLQEKFKRDFTAQPTDITVTSLDEQLLQKTLNAVEKHISNPAFDTTTFASEVGVSRMLLNTKIKALTGQTSGEFIRTLRLKRAAQLLKQNTGNVSEIAYEVGMHNLSYFTKTFREQFGTTPSQFVADNF